MISRKQKIAAFITALIFGAVILGSLFFIASASDHDCAGDDCKICEIIQQCEILLNTVGNAVKPCASLLAALFILTAVLLCGRAVFGRKTLISLKVELLD